jgi:hypothetical protein
LPFHLQLGFPNSFFPSDFPKILYAFLISLMRAFSVSSLIQPV